MDVAVDLVTGIWMEVVATVGVGAVEFTRAVGMVAVGTGWARIHTLYPFLLIFALPFVTCFWCCGFSNHGVGAWLGCLQLGWLWMGLLQTGLGLELGLGPRFPSNSK